MASSSFPIENIPFGIITTEQNPLKRVASIIGDHVLDVKLLSEHGVFDDTAGFHGQDAIKCALASQTLNQFASLPYDTRSYVRDRIAALVSDTSSILFTKPGLNELAFTHMDQVTMNLPMDFRSFSDFLCSETHLDNGNKITGNSMPSFHVFPVAYNGRTTSIVTSGTPVTRPKGFTRQPPQPSQTGNTPTFTFSPSAKFDFELELGVILSTPIPRGQIITADEADGHIFGFVLLNDWSARDIQFGEMGAMGPYNGKSTATTISPWVVLHQALEEARCELLSQRARADMSSRPKHLRHMEPDKRVNWNVRLQASLSRAGGPCTVLCRSNLQDLYWTPGQMLAQMASSGSGTSTGDLIGTGTLSSPGHSAQDPTLGCLFELTEGGKKAIKLHDGSELTWLQDYDEIILTGWTTEKGGKTIGFGEARGVLMPAAV